VPTFYLAYYELHEIPWKLKDKIIFQDKKTGAQFQIGRGPYHIPLMASPEVKTRAGGATISTKNDSYVLEGGTYFGAAIPLLPEGEPYVSISLAEWDRLGQMADDAASCVGLCFDQRVSLKKVAEYIRFPESGGSRPRELYMWRAHPGAKASVSKRSVNSVERALNTMLYKQVSPATELALRWFEHSKAVMTGPDRLIALWIALEALFGPVERGTELVNKTARHLALKRYRLNLTPSEIKKALGLNYMREMRNEVVHSGVRWVPWPVSDERRERDWPQILNDIVGEILRYRLNATLTMTLHKHVEEGQQRSSK